MTCWYVINVLFSDSLIHCLTHFAPQLCPRGLREPIPAHTGGRKGMHPGWSSHQSIPGDSHKYPQTQRNTQFTDTVTPSGVFRVSNRLKKGSEGKPQLQEETHTEKSDLIPGPCCYEVTVLIQQYFSFLKDQILHNVNNLCKLFILKDKPLKISSWKPSFSLSYIPLRHQSAAVLRQMQKLMMCDIFFKVTEGSMRDLVCQYFQPDF